MSNVLAVETPSGYRFPVTGIYINDGRWKIERLTPELPEKPGTVIDIFKYDDETFTLPVRAMLCPDGMWVLARDINQRARAFSGLIDDFEVVLS